MRKWWKSRDSRPTNGSVGVLGKLRRDSRGNTLAMMGAALVPIAAMIGSGLDMSRAYMAQAKLQNACDAAALAARREMTGNIFTANAQSEGERFFAFNFPDDTMNSENVSVSVAQASGNSSAVRVAASADVPTTIMGMFGTDFIPISVECDADQDYGNNDIMVVLDVTGSMQWFPGTSSGSGQAGTKIARLRTGTVGLYRALSGATNTRTRYGIMPYSVTVNVGRSLRNQDVLRTTYYQKRGTYICTRYNRNGNCNQGYYPYSLEPVSILNTQWRSGSDFNQSIQNWRQNGEACIEERPTFGNPAHEIEIETSVSRNDIDVFASQDTHLQYQWGRYDQGEQEATSSGVCPAEATQLRTYSNETGFNNAIAAATTTVSGSTYHDVGLIWAARFLSSTGMFASQNPEVFNGVPVSKHIVFMTDGIISTSSSTYSTYGVDNRDDRVNSSLGLNAQHVARFQAACNRAKSMGMTIWVVALDVADTSDIEPCATSSGHFFVSDGTDLEDVFARIGQGIGRLRLTQ